MTYLKLGTGELGRRHRRHRSIDLSATPRLELVAHLRVHRMQQQRVPEANYYKYRRCNKSTLTSTALL